MRNATGGPHLDGRRRGSGGQTPAISFGLAAGSFAVGLALAIVGVLRADVFLVVWGGAFIVIAISWLALGLRRKRIDSSRNR
jgi:hypothetical protein